MAEQNYSVIGENVEMSVADPKYIMLRIPKAAAGRPSHSGGSTTLATTPGKFGVTVQGVPAFENTSLSLRLTKWPTRK